MFAGNYSCPSKKSFLGSVAALFIIVITISSCSSGGGSGRSGGESGADFDCDGACQNLNLSVADVQRILTQGVASSQAMGVAGTFAVVDRVGNVLSLYQMTGAAGSTTANGQIGAQGVLEGLTFPSVLSAISKAGTGAYLSSQGNAFSTRTASQIVQEHFNPGEFGQPGGPLFGVQFSQLPCSDITVRDSSLADGRPLGGGKFSFPGMIGPRSLPLGLAGDPGGLPLYKNGDLVGGVGVEIDGVYTLDRNIADYDDDIEERIALYATIGFEAPSQRVAPNMNVGKSLRYTDLGYENLLPLDSVGVTLGDANFVALPEYTSGAIREGTIFGDVASGVAEVVRAGVPAAILVKPDGSPRYPSRAGAPLAGGVQLSAVEVEALLDSALLTANRARAAIRRPLDTAARVSIWVVDTTGAPLGFVRSQDAPVFGIDVSLQKGRTAVLLSSPDAGAALASSGLGEYVAAARNLMGAGALTGQFAITDRAVGNLARPYFPDGITTMPNGPFSLPFPGTSAATKTWSPFNTGLQFDIMIGGLASALGLVPSSSFPDSCAPAALTRRVANGIQIFPGAVPIYRGRVLIGAVGISGDGIDQDDLIAFYGSSRRGLDFAGHTAIGDPDLGFNAPRDMRSDLIEFPIDDLRLRYVNCPEAPFSGSNDQNVCDGL